MKVSALMLFTCIKHWVMTHFIFIWLLWMKPVERPETRTASSWPPFRQEAAAGVCTWTDSFDSPPCFLSWSAALTHLPVIEPAEQRLAAGGLRKGRDPTSVAAGAWGQCYLLLTSVNYTCICATSKTICVCTGNGRYLDWKLETESKSDLLLALKMPKPPGRCEFSSVLSLISSCLLRVCLIGRVETDVPVVEKSPTSCTSSAINSSLFTPSSSTSSLLLL